MQDERAIARQREHQVRELSKDEMQQTLGGGTLVGNPGKLRLFDSRDSSTGPGIFIDSFESGD